jgi:hypothetical protein
VVWGDPGREAVTLRGLLPSDRPWQLCGRADSFQGRQIVTSFRRPKDGVSLLSSTKYPDGIPRQRAELSPSLPQLPEGHKISADLQLETDVAYLSEAKRLPGVQAVGRCSRKRPPTKAFKSRLKEIITPPDQREPLAGMVLRQSDTVRLSHDDEHQARLSGGFPVPAAKGGEAELAKQLSCADFQSSGEDEALEESLQPVQGSADVESHNQPDEPPVSVALGSDPCPASPLRRKLLRLLKSRRGIFFCSSIANDGPASGRFGP